MAHRAAVAISVLALGLSLAAPPARAEFFDDLLTGGLFGDLPAALAAGTDPVDVAGLLHTGVQDWINSDVGRQVDDVINALTGSFAIGNGAPGTESDPAGGAGGWLLGDGGTGWSPPQSAGTPGAEAGVAGGAGGDAGFWGDGGAGGNGGAGAAGGDGGAGGWLAGTGGAGGNAGDGVGANGLPALGGAGGSAGIFGIHGAVGHFGTAPGGPPAPAAVEVTGNWLTNGDGQVVMLHGLNQVYKVAPYEPSADGFGSDDAAFLAANGFNAVRLGVIWAGVEPQPGVIDYAYLASVEQTVQTLAKYHIVAILDMHQDLYSEAFGGEGAPAWAVQTGGLPNPDLGFPTTYLLNPAENHAWDVFWGNAKASDGVGLENHYAAMWQAVADYFKGNPNVAGYDIMNEPWPGSQTLPGILGSPHFGAQQLTPFYNQVDAAIRSVDPNTTVYFEPNPLVGSLPVQTHLGTVDDPNSVYSFHNYCITTSLIPDASFGCGLNADIVVDNAEAYATSHDIPAVMTEFGATGAIPTLTAGMQAANNHLLGWTEWAYSGNDITSASPNGQALVLDPSKPPVGDNVDTAKLAALAEPYPQAISGTPTSWSFEDGVFRLGYTTARADGDGAFAAGSQTSISVPAIEYPNGYQVSVTGGQVVSAPGAALLLIASNPGATTVSVTVRPAG